jgi:uncharacterized protein YjdB
VTQITLRIASIGDIHNNQINLAKIQTYLTTAKNSGKLDFFVHSGDMSSSSSNSSQMSACKAKFDAIGAPYFVACGNHDVSGSACYANKSNGNETCGNCNFKTTFGYCHRITTFNKSGQDFQIVIPGILWSGSAYWKIDLVSASKTLPTVVVVHGPLFKPPGIPGCGAWDSLHTYAFSLKPGVDALKTMVTYSGHIHEACISPTGTDVVPTINTLYVVQDAVGSSRCSSSENNFIGYTKITYDTMTSISTKRYKKVNYTTAFVDPFPDVGPITLTSMTVSPAPASVSIGSTTQLTAVCKDQNSNTMACPNLTWSSSDISKATVDATGKVTGIIAGTTNVTAKSGNITSNISMITVVPQQVLTSITVSPATVSININGTVQLTATCKDQHNGTMTCPVLTWASSAPTKATVNTTGKVTGVTAGMANITATSAPIVSNSSTVTVSIVPNAIVVTNPTLGIAYHVGESRVVRWTHAANTGANVKIELLKTGVLSKTISSSTPNDDQMAWTIPSVSAGNNYQIRVTSTANAQYTGISGNFTIN